MITIQIHIIILLISLVAVAIISSTKAQENSIHMQNNNELSIAIKEMEKANYFSFVMLINMLQTLNSKLESNITFLMPKDKTLSTSNIIHQDSISDFLLRHSIPSPLIFEHLNLIPNGSIVPSSLPHYTLKISNGGKSNYFLNNVKIISRNICSLGSIKCHGIDGILLSTSNSTSDDNDYPHKNHTLPFSSCPSSQNNTISHNTSDHNSDQSGHNQTWTGPSPAPAASPVNGPSPATAPSPVNGPTRLLKSESSRICKDKMLSIVVVFILGLKLCVIGV